MAGGEDFAGAVRRLADDIRQRVDREQRGVPTFADHVWLALVAHLEHDEARDPQERDAVEGLTRMVARRDEGRLVDYDTRAQGAGRHGARDIGYFEMVTSQGETACLRWKGMPLFKTVYDFSLYPMLLWELRPATIIELGSGLGTSALWLADVAAAFALELRLYSVALLRPPLRDDRITFIEGDCEAIDSALPEAMLRELPHPWIVIEDAHVNVHGILRHLHPFLTSGDYLIVEDSDGKQDELRHFLARRRGCYKVDTYYTDFFGRNATSAQDSILVRTETDS